MTLFQLLELGSYLKDQLTEKMKEVHGLTYTDWLALHALAKSPCTHSQLVTVLGITKGGTTKVIQRLEKQDLLQVEDGIRNKGTLYKLTTHGEGLTGRLWIRYEETNKVLQRALSKSAVYDLSKWLPEALSLIKSGKPKEPENLALKQFEGFRQFIADKK